MGYEYKLPKYVPEYNETQFVKIVTSDTIWVNFLEAVKKMKTQQTNEL